MLIENYFGEYTPEKGISINQLSIHKRRNELKGVELIGAFALVRG